MSAVDPIPDRLTIETLRGEFRSGPVIDRELVTEDCFSEWRYSVEIEDHIIKINESDL